MKYYIEKIKPLWAFRGFYTRTYMQEKMKLSSITK